VDSSRNAYGRDCDCAAGDHRSRPTPERKGMLPLLFDTLNSPEPVHRERTSEKGEKFLTTSISTRCSPCWDIPHVRYSACIAFVALPTKHITPRAVIMILPNSQQIGGDSRCRQSKVGETKITDEGQSNSHMTSFPTPPKTSTRPSFSNLRKWESRLCAAPSQRLCG